MAYDGGAIVMDLGNRAMIAGRVIQSVVVTACALALAASLALADPGVRVTYVSGVPQVELEGSYAQSHYAVYRGADMNERGVRITSDDLLCIGPCWAQDPAAEPGRTYWYRFELAMPNGSHATFGPYAVTISPTLAARVAIAILPNPARAGTRIDLRIGGPPSDGPVAATATLHDLSGRVVSTLFRGSLPRGTTSLKWDGRDDRSRRLPTGLYFIRLETPLGTRVERLLRLD